MRYIILLLALLLPLAGHTEAQQYAPPQAKKISAEEKARRGDKLKGYRIQPYTGQPQQVNLHDTIAYSSHNLVAPERRSLGVSYQGNANSPWWAKVFFDRSAKTPDFAPLAGYQSMLYSPDNILFYDTKTPLTFVHYRKNFSDDVLEEVLNGTLSVNLGKRINIGASAEHVSAAGYYQNNKSRNVDYRIFGSYTSPRYDLWASVSNDYYKQMEYGGISDMSYITNPDDQSNGRVRLGSLDIPVAITGRLFNRIRSGNGFLSHRYKLGYYKKVEPTTKPQPSAEAKPMERPDSLVFIPVGSISHQVHYNKSSRRMIANEAGDLWSTLYGTPVVNERTTTTTSTDPTTSATTTNTTSTLIPNDLTELKTLKNTFSLSLMEGFRPWVKAGLSAYVRTENYWAYSADATTMSHVTQDKFFSAFVGGELARRSGKGLNFGLQGEIGIAGKDLGAVSVEGDIQTKFRFAGKDFGLKLDGRLLNFRPSYFAQHNHNTWGWHNEDFNFTRRLELGARADFSSFGTWAELRTASIQNHIYWTSNARAAQNSSLVQMSMLRAGHAYRVGPLGWSLEAAYQLSTDASTIPVPSLTTRGDLYLDFMIAKVLHVQLGAEAYWHSAYHAPYYHPVVMQFTNQDQALIGGKAPLMNAYANFRMRTNRFYVRMYNVGEMLFRAERQNMHLYVNNPMHLEAGVVIDLKN